MSREHDDGHKNGRTALSREGLSHIDDPDDPQDVIDPGSEDDRLLGRLGSTDQRGVGLGLD